MWMEPPPPPATPLPPYVLPKGPPAMVEYVPDSEDEEECSIEEVGGTTRSTSSSQVRRITHFSD